MEESFGKVPMPPQLRALDKEISGRVFKEIMHNVSCGCGDCKTKATSNAKILTFGMRKGAVEEVKEAAKREVVIIRFKSNIDKDLKYL